MKKILSVLLSVCLLSISLVSVSAEEKVTVKLLSANVETEYLTEQVDVKYTEDFGNNKYIAEIKDLGFSIENSTSSTWYARKFYSKSTSFSVAV